MAQNDPLNSFAGQPYDGHFVMFNDKTLQNQGLMFLATLAQGAPVVVK